MAGISNTKEKSSGSGTGGQGEPPDFANESLLALRRTEPISDELARQICLTVRLFAGNPQEAMQVGLSAKSSLVCLEGETQKALIHRTLLVALAGRYGYTTEIPPTSFPTYLTAINNQHPTETLRHFAMAILDKRIKDIQEQSQLKLSEPLVSEFKQVIKAAKKWPDKKVTEALHAIIVMPFSEITSEAVANKLQSEFKLKLPKFSELDDLTSSIRFDASKSREPLRAEIESPWVKNWYPDDLTRLVIMYRYGQCVSSKDLVSILDNKISDIIPTLSSFRPD
jgi:hypothetical protein